MHSLVKAYEDQGLPIEEFIESSILKVWEKRNTGNPWRIDQETQSIYTRGLYLKMMKIQR